MARNQRIYDNEYKAQAEEDVKIDYTLQTYGDTEDVTVTQDAGSMTISQTAESASMVGKGIRPARVLKNKKIDIE